MKSINLALAALLFATASTFAAEAWKEGQVGGVKVFTNAKGMSLYTSEKDGMGKSDCNAACATNWPPLKAEASAKPMGEWSVISRDDGTKMWAYQDKPVYTFIKDKKPGEANGDGVGKVWHLLKVD